MITGDHKITAVAVAKELGIMRRGNALSGAELELMSDEQFETAIHNTVVFARISPAHKLKIVQAFMDEGNIVAMTGDGVNDAPALKKADIGIAMGITGTDVSKEAADMILTDDNFASIVNAIEEGRSIFENIRKYLVFLLSGNMGTVFALVFTLLSDMPIPLNAVQILFINFIMDGLIAIALGVEPPEPGIMKHKPRNVREGILNRDTLVYIGFVGGLIAFITCGVYVWAIFRKFSPDEAKTMFFYTLIFARLFNGFNCRSLEQSVLSISFWSNKVLLLSSIITVVLSIGIILSPDLQLAFSIKPLNLVAWTGVLGASFIVLIIVEFWKMLIRTNAH
jgi:Ca2+-transporting ATPase